MPVSKAKAAQVADRRRRAIQLRLAGIDLATIADRLGYASPQAVSVDITRALEQTARGLQVDADQRRARLLGLDAPTKVRGEWTSDMDREIQDLVDRLTATPFPQRGEVGDR